MVEEGVVYINVDIAKARHLLDWLLSGVEQSVAKSCPN